MRFATLTLGALLAAASPAALADTTVWLIGGGPDIDSSQGQIEDNVRWLESLLLERDVDVRTYFGLGGHPGKDVSRWQPPTEEDPALGPLARIFGEAVDYGIAFERHDLRAVEGSTIKDELVPSLRSDFEQHDPGNSVLVVYNGHGERDYSDAAGNSLRLWGEQGLDVREVDGVLDRLPDGTTTRFVMTQCYSGAFHSLIYEDPGRREEVDPGRCGFSSESARRQAEGCALALDERQYKDYSTFFFAALSGETRLGEPIPEASVDRDGDGRASYREAHLYTLANALSSDLPRSTSEAYLLDWTPWYLRWDSSVDGSHSVYWTLANDVARRHGWEISRGALEAQRRRFSSALREHRARRDDSRAQAKQLQQQLRAALATRWPELEHPYSPVYAKLLSSKAAAIARYARDDPRYAKLVEHQDRAREAGLDMLDATRHITQIDKIYWLRKLARLEAALQIYGNRQAQREYAALIECERGHIETG